MELRAPAFCLRSALLLGLVPWRRSLPMPSPLLKLLFFSVREKPDIEVFCDDPASALQTGEAL
jgi:hypothetical protein